MYNVPFFSVCSLIRVLYVSKKPPVGYLSEQGLQCILRHFQRLYIIIKNYYILYQRSSIKSVQFQPSLVINSNLVPQVKVGDSFRYLGRYFDFAISNDIHKKELIAILTDSLSQIDRLRCTLRTS